MTPDAPRLVFLTTRRVDDDLRTRQFAFAARADGWEATILCPTPLRDAETGAIADLPVLRVPVEDALLHGIRDGHPDADPQATALAARRSAARQQVAGIRFPAVTGLGDDDRRPPVEIARALDLDLAFAAHLQALRPAVIHAAGVRALAAAVMAAADLRASGHRVRVVYDAVDDVTRLTTAKGRLRKGPARLEQRLLPAVDAVVAPDPTIATGLAARLAPGAPSPRVVPTVPVATQGRRRLREEIPVAADTPVLALFGQHRSGIAFVTSALHALPDLNAVVVTEPPEIRYLPTRAFVSEQGVAHRVHFVASPGPARLGAFLSDADIGMVGLLPGGTASRTLPLELAIAAQAGGLPLICPEGTDLAAHVTSHSLGAAYAPDLDAFTEALRTALTLAAEDLADRFDAALRDPEPPLASLAAVHRSLVDQVPTPRGRLAVSDIEAPLRLPDLRLRFPPAPRDDPTAPGWRPLADTPVRLGLAPANYAGQLAALAQAVTTATQRVSAEVTMRSPEASFGFAADRYDSLEDLARLDTQVGLLTQMLSGYTHLIADAFLPVFGTLNGTTIAADLPALRQAGVRVALLAHGSEIRDPVGHLDREPESFFAAAPDPSLVARMSAIARRNRALAEGSHLPTFVTTPDLLDDLPGATWLPLTIDVDAWRCDRPILQRPRPVVLHAPSKRWPKGTDRFLPALEAMAARGLIELDLVEGLDWRHMRERIWNADVVVDQVGIGSYGVFACEAMAAGRIVMVHLAPAVAERLGEPVPVVNTTGRDLTGALERLLDDRAAAAQVGKDAVDFVERFHSGGRAVRALASFLGL